MPLTAPSKQTLLNFKCSVGRLVWRRSLSKSWPLPARTKLIIAPVANSQDPLRHASSPVCSQPVVAPLDLQHYSPPIVAVSCNMCHHRKRQLDRTWHCEHTARPWHACNWKRQPHLTPITYLNNTLLFEYMLFPVKLSFLYDSSTRVLAHRLNKITGSGISVITGKNKTGKVISKCR